ncbi:rhamnan synthesis F family protein [Stenotrophomonas sp. BIO128-Bstrain]|jgi:FMN phosphatase YigB (HAD superfamily)|uniref:rhamnan synthesis F family protein n=1 Tax=Stenotrophomonas sp. BIO128-Bstrain TaxID=3027225 RepID=UPI0024DE3B11|nr:rhamnan synthesis F family protein [Stenotrophomonas sp. BIO128-Bstrain]WIA60699.1 rhamnan synthesis F family protein [Stenotrophomonas sp. BIO128-Bstrain]
MMWRLSRYFLAAEQAISRHGGGLPGLWSVVCRSFKVIRAMGLRGFSSRLRQASASRSRVAQPAEHTFPDPIPLAQLQQRVGIMAHVFYPDLIEEFATLLGNVPVPFELLVSVMDEDAKARAEQRFGLLSRVSALHVRIVPNRGRDIAPMLVTFRDEILSLDVIGHIHTKKSLYTGSEQESWRHYLLTSLLGTEQRVAWILGMFQAEPRLGLVYPESYEGVPLWAHTWLSNAEVGEALAARLGIVIDRNAYIDFPAGSMFWARVDALRPLFELNLAIAEFPEEKGQIDGTLQHAVERIFATLIRQQSYLLGVLAGQDTPMLTSEGQRNWLDAFSMPVAERLLFSALDADLVTMDVFDTLVTRPFLTPQAARAYLSFHVATRYGVPDFHQLREQAEERARLSLGRDPTIDEIYARFAETRSVEKPSLLLDVELSMERRMLSPRDGLVAAVRSLKGKRLVALSDMYLPTSALLGVLPASISDLTQEWWVSCQTGRRKDEIATWADISARESVPKTRWLHVGDNEHADVQMPQLAGLLTPVHALRGSALLDVVPGLRPLRHREGTQAPWSEQLWRGLVVNQFQARGDLDPASIAPTPTLDAYATGYAVLGPVVLDYLVWVSRVAKERGTAAVLFLSREGYLLKRAWDLLSSKVPALTGFDSHYLLVSRRAAGMASLRGEADLPRLLHGSYTGPLINMVSSRLGEEAAAVVRGALRSQADKEIYLPDMLTEVVALVEPALPSLLAIAARERDDYLGYWEETVGDQQVLISDLGYAGTIQTYLSMMIGRPLDGAYFALRASVSKLDGFGWAAGRYHDGRSAPDSTSSILKHDLLLEALLAAPTGQFCGFRNTENGREAQFSSPELSDDGMASLAQVHEGALAFLSNTCAAIGEDVEHLQLEGAGVLVPLQCVADGHWSAGSWLEELATDDSFTGRGRVAAGVAGSVSR